MIQNNKDNVSIWLIGPSAAGKTTVSKLLYEEIKEKMNFVIIDGDKVRNLYENNLGYDKNSRSKNTKRYINLVNWLSNFNISSIVAVISPFEKDRDYCRKEIKNYIEIYLKSSRTESIVQIGTSDIVLFLADLSKRLCNSNPKSKISLSFLIKLFFTLKNLIFFISFLTKSNSK